VDKLDEAWFRVVDMTDSTLNAVLPLTERLLTEIRKRIVDALAPERVILFGSYAEGRATADSDLDLLVVTDRSVSRKECLARTQDLFRDMPCPFR
jgi:predicted nucleotidyltransferase